MSPKELVDSLCKGVHLIGLKVVDGPHAVSDQQSVVYLQGDDGVRLRVQVTQ